MINGPIDAPIHRSASPCPHLRFCGESVDDLSANLDRNGSQRSDRPFAERILVKISQIALLTNNEKELFKAFTAVRDRKNLVLIDA